MRLINGVEFIDQRVNRDMRGDLLAFEHFSNVPFPMERVFVMKVSSSEVTRGGHANSCDELIVALTGSVEIQVDNGDERTAIGLDGYDRALWIKPGILIHLRDFRPGTLLLVCASARYGETRHYDRAQPHLFMADCLA